MCLLVVHSCLLVCPSVHHNEASSLTRLEEASERYIQLDVHTIHNDTDNMLRGPCRNGLNTTMGSMVRELVSPTRAGATHNPFVQVRRILLNALAACLSLSVMLKHVAESDL